MARDLGVPSTAIPADVRVRRDRLRGTWNPYPVGEHSFDVFFAADDNLAVFVRFGFPILILAEFTRGIQKKKK